MAKIVFLPIMIAVFLSTTLALDLTGDWRASTGEWCEKGSNLKKISSGF